MAVANDVGQVICVAVDHALGRVLLLSFALNLVLASADPATQEKPDTAPRGEKPASLRIGVYDYKLPPWWDSVKVEVPVKLQTSHDVFKHVWATYGYDVGTRENWKEALKAHALGEQKVNGFPVFIAHCLMTGEDYRGAAEVYADLYALAETQGEHKDWYRCYLAYKAGVAYELLDDFEKARMWSLRAAAHVGNEDKTIAFYAKHAAERAKRHQPVDPAMTSNDPEYGFSEKKPIKVGSKDELAGPAAGRAYLDGLRDEKGKEVTYKRIGSSATSEGKSLDVFEVSTSTGKKGKLYLDMYHPENAPEKQLAPKGFSKSKG